MTDLRWIDDHCHIHGEHRSEDGPDASVDAAASEGVVRLITVGCDVADSRQAIAVAAAHAEVYATAGVHPHEASGGIDGLVELLDAPEVVAVGECGLDYHYDHSPRTEQAEVFAAQIRLALERDLALVIHTREAWDDTFAILGEVGVPERTVFHCFTGGPDEVRRCLDIGAVISFSGIITFKTAQDVRDAAGICPLDRVLVETDAPYLAPLPHRGRRNTPAWVPLVGAGLAGAMGRAVGEIAEATWANAARTYRLPA